MKTCIKPKNEHDSFFDMKMKIENAWQGRPIEQTLQSTIGAALRKSYRVGEMNRACFVY